MNIERTPLGQQDFEAHVPKWDGYERPTEQAWIATVNEHVTRQLEKYGFRFTASDKVDAAFWYLQDLVEQNALTAEEAGDLYIKFQQIYGGA